MRLMFGILSFVVKSYPRNLPVPPASLAFWHVHVLLLLALGCVVIFNIDFSWSKFNWRLELLNQVYSLALALLCFVYLWSMLLAMFTLTCFPTPTRRVEFDQWLVSPIRWVDLCQRLSFIIIGSVQLRKCYATLSASTMLHGAWCM